jgi:crotonobetainyl-CoA:carnitine CoA-transferase CaiB-like acyl-CoA transferase
MFGALGVLAALYQRPKSGRGQHVTASLFESAVFLIGQHMAQYAVTGRPAGPMPERISAWAIYDVFETADEQPVFVGVVTDGQWRIFCDAFELKELAADPVLSTNDERVRQRARIIPIIKDTFGQYSKAALLAKLEQIGLPFAPINRPQDMFDDEHLNAGGALLDIGLTDGENRGKRTKLPALPLHMGGQRLGLTQDVPHSGENTETILAELGYSAKEIKELTAISE